MSTHANIRPASYADIEALPENIVGQILFGVLHTHPRPALRHARSATRLTSEIEGPFDRGRGGPGGWIILAEPEVHFGAHVVVPDIAGWKRNRLAKLPDAAYSEIAPDWICEVLSPSTARIDRTDKLTVYAEYGISHTWLVDPDLKTLEVFALTDGKWVLLSTFKDADDVAASPFETHQFLVQSLWADI